MADQQQAGAGRHTLAQPGAYQMVKELGKGAFGCVLLARNTKTGELVAIKKLERSDVNKYVESEILNHSQLRHPHVVQFREAFLSPHHVNIVMDYASGGSLFNFVQQKHRLKEPLARWFFQQLVLAVDYCHRKGVAMRDIKLENTLLQVIPGLPRPLVKICDFGYSKLVNRSIARSKVGTINYMAPEVLHNREGHYDGRLADIWSCGVILYTMLVGRYPFQGPTEEDETAIMKGMVHMLQKMKQHEISLPEQLGISPGCADLLGRLLHPDTSQRISMAGIMSHPWFLADLPADALNMNDRYLASSKPCAQSEAEIRAVVREAMRHDGEDDEASMSMDDHGRLMELDQAR